MSEDEEADEIRYFSNRITREWGDEEAHLRTAIYVSFMKESDQDLLRKRVV